MIFGKHINGYYLKYAYMLLLGLLALICVDYIQLQIPVLYKYVIKGIKDGVVVIDGVTHNFNLDFLLDQICKPLLFIILFMVIGRFLWRICFFGSAIKVETDIRSKMFDHCKNLSHEYYQVNKVGNLMSLFTNDLETIQDCFGSGILLFCDIVCLGGLAIYKMFRLNYVMALFSLIPMVLCFVISEILSKSMMKKWDKRQEAFSSLSDFAQESFSGIAVIKAFVKEIKELHAFKKLNKNNEDANVAYVKTSTLLDIIITLFVETVVCVILGLGGYLVKQNTFTAEELVEFSGYFSSVIWPIMAIGELMSMKSMGKTSLKRVSELLDAKQTVFDSDTATDITDVKGKIEFKNLTFKYPDGDYNVLENLSFTINAGENVGLFGKTGSGKTTVVDLILRIYNVDKNQLFLDDKDVNDITIKSLRDNVSYVPQDNFLFSDTIANNIAFAVDEADEKKIKDYAKFAVVDENISEFKDKYQTVLGERGVTISGGQKQRISIARALMKDAPVLIMDDSVSAVDTDTERQLLTNFKNIRKGKTTILIAHRVTTIEQMDKIVFIEDGKVLAVGSHEELLKTCKEYKTAVELQKLEEEGGNEQ